VEEVYPADTPDRRAEKRTFMDEIPGRQTGSGRDSKLTGPENRAEHKWKVSLFSFFYIHIIFGTFV